MKDQGMTLKDLVRGRKEDEPSLQIHMGPIHEALDGQSPELDETAVGRHRLISALTQRYGQGFKLIPAAKKALEHYDREADVITLIKHNRRKFHAR